MLRFSTIWKKRFILLLATWIIIVIFVLLQMFLLGVYRGEPVWSLSDYFIYFFIQFFLGVFLIVLYIIPFYDYSKKWSNIILKFFVFCLHGIGYGLIYVALLMLVYEVKTNGVITEGFEKRCSDYFFSDFHNVIKTYLIFIVILFFYDLFLKNLEEVVQRKNLENHINTIKLQALKSQLHPHFLFNALNNIVALIDENRKKAQSILVDLSDLLRYSVNLNPAKIISLQDEIALTKKYVSIEESKYEEQLEVFWEVSEKCPIQELPPLTLQPLIENAIKHGFVNNTQVLKIIIQMDELGICIKNNGTTLSTSLNLGQGLKNVKEKLAIHFGSEYQFELYQEEGWVINRIKKNS